MQDSQIFRRLCQDYVRKVGKQHAMYAGVSSSFSLQKAGKGRGHLVITRSPQASLPPRVTMQRIVNSYRQFAPEFLALEEWYVELELKADNNPAIISEGSFLFKNEAFSEIEGGIPLEEQISLKLETESGYEYSHAWDLYNLPWLINSSTHLQIEPLASGEAFFVESSSAHFLIQLQLERLWDYTLLSLHFDGSVGNVYPGPREGQGPFSVSTQAKRFLVLPNHDLPRLKQYKSWIAFKAQ